MKALNRHVGRVFNPERKDRGSGNSRETSDRSVSQWTAGTKTRLPLQISKLGRSRLSLTLEVLHGSSSRFSGASF
jgi:hypothetical protein